MSDSLHSYFFHSPLGYRLKIHQTFESLDQLDPEQAIIVFRHGNGLSALCYWPFLKHFLSDYELVLIGAQAHGLSENGKTFAGWDQACDEIQPLLTRYESHPLIAMGHSFGAILSLLSASRNLGMYQQVLALDPILFTPYMAMMMAPLADKEFWHRVFPLARQARRRNNGWRDRQQAYEYFYQRGMFKTWSNEALQAYVDHALIPSDDNNESAVMLACPPWMEAQVFATYPKRVWHELKALNIPTLFLHGDKTYRFVAVSARKLMRRNHWVKSQQVEGDHCFMLGQPEFFAQMVLSYLRAQKCDDKEFCVK